MYEGGVRICSDAVLLDFWCSFAEIFILSRSIAVLQHQVVCSIFYVFPYIILCCVYKYFCAVLQYSYPPYAPIIYGPFQFRENYYFPVHKGYRWVSIK